MSSGSAGPGAKVGTSASADHAQRHTRRVPGQDDPPTVTVVQVMSVRRLVKGR
jgi:hypothetical protein